jgi:hypothetical protein
MRFTKTMGKEGLKLEPKHNKICDRFFIIGAMQTHQSHNLAL